MNKEQGISMIPDNSKSPVYSGKTRLARIIRIISVPPVMICVLLVLLRIFRAEIFLSPEQIWILFICLGIVPVLAYPAQFFIPAFRESGRKGQRTLAFIFTLIGYTAAFIWALCSKVSPEIMVLCSSYFITAVFLAAFQKLTPIRASGHAASVTGPLIILISFVSWIYLFPCLVFTGAIAWSSLVLKRHTAAELLSGCLLSLAAFGLSCLIFL